MIIVEAYWNGSSWPFYYCEWQLDEREYALEDYNWLRNSFAVMGDDCLVFFHEKKEL
jgi:hypothetical protein